MEFPLQSRIASLWGVVKTSSSAILSVLVVALGVLLLLGIGVLVATKHDQEPIRFDRSIHGE